MNIKNIQDVLPLIERPSRYLGSEINTIKKNHSKVKLRIALAFPDLYEIGTSHFGLQILYHILNNHKDIAAERVFAPEVDMEDYLRSFNIPLMTLESHKPLGVFDIIGFSLLYELNFTNVLTMLDLANIPFFASQRDTSYPLVIAGGPCTCNPEPVADFFDAIVIGDGENVVMEMSQIWLEWKKNVNDDKKALLKKWSDIEGVYIPGFFKPEFDKYGFQKLLPELSNYKSVTRAIIKDLDKAPFPDTPIIAYGKPVHDLLRLEVSRGCTRGCRFCQARMIYRPVRERSVETLLTLSDNSIAATGYADMSLLSLSTGDYGCIVPLMEHLMARYKDKNISVSFPSLRAGTLTPELINLVKKVRKTGFTIAPEAGSQRLRDIINKNITEKDIVDTVGDVFGLGWQVIKLYFMIGLPFEKDEDLQAIVDLVKQLRKIKNQKGQRGKINVSITTFIPKPHTPFQWAPQISLSESKEKINWLRKELKLPGIHFKWQNPEVSGIEGIFARGDRRLGRLLVTAYKKGCKFDGWSDKFKYELWKEAFFDEGIDVDFYTTRARDMAEPLPWDHINTRVTKGFLKKEWEKASKGDSTPDCRAGDCNACGVCDFEVIKPKVFETFKRKTEPDRILKTSQPDSDAPDIKETLYKKLRISYSKQNQAKYFGHLELVNIFLRALSRSNILLKFSNGFHPKPQISFGDTLPLGMESLNEFLYLTVQGIVQPQAIIKGLNNHLPEGLAVHDCRFITTKSAGKESESASYLVTMKNSFFDENKLKHFVQAPEFIVIRTNRKGKIKKINLKDMILKIDLLTPYKLQMTLKIEQGKTVRPFEVVKAIFNMPEEKIRQAGIIKQRPADV